MPPVWAPEPVEAVWEVEHAANRATADTAPRILMFILLRPWMGGYQWVNGRWVNGKGAER
jgi:hypothetical protein